MTETNGPGRPVFVPTDEDRQRVQVLKAQGMSHEAIAAAIGISHPTLAKYFSIDLEVAVAKKTAEILEARFRSAMGGSVPAQNKFLEMAGSVPPSRKREKAEPKLGKKEMQDAEANTAHEGSEWDGILQ